jgi:nicotinamide-nucleotide amidase
VHLACARRGGGTAHRDLHLGDIGRGPVRIAAIRTALDMMMEALGND